MVVPPPSSVHCQAEYKTYIPTKVPMYRVQKQLFFFHKIRTFVGQYPVRQSDLTVVAHSEKLTPLNAKQLPNELIE